MHLFKYLGYHLMFVEGFHIMRINNMLIIITTIITIIIIVIYF